jgi:NAD(P)H-hydrate epimerase
MKLVTAAAMRDLDRYTIEDVGLPGVVLMEVAGRGVATHTAALLRDSGRTGALILCGPGNNGGDGFVAARHLADDGFDVAVMLFVPPDAIRGDALVQFRTLSRFPVRILEAGDGLPADAWNASSGVIVDSLFGTGLGRPVTGPFAKVIEAANAAPCPRVAVDLPTGIDADTGRVLGCAFRADLTVTFGAAKIGHFSQPGRSYAGRVEVVPIGIPRAAIEAAAGAILIDRAVVSPAFPDRDAQGFKNRYGHLLVVGGLPGKAGAAMLAAKAAVRTGAGLVTIATSAPVRIEGLLPEVMVEGPFELDAARIGVEAQALEAVLSGKTALAVGPGLSMMPGVEAILEALLRRPIPIVLDADALNAMARSPEKRWVPGPGRVMTPHPGEASRLLEVAVADVQTNRVGAAQALASRYRTVVALKGASTVIAAPDGRLAVNPTGGSGLATAGSGDVLTGMVGALLARGIPAFEATCAACWVHGAAGDAAETSLTEHAVSASDVVEAVPGVLRSLAMTAGSERRDA